MRGKSTHDALAKFEERRNNKLRQTISGNQQNVKRESKQFVGLASQTGAGRNSQALSIVPVKVKARGKGKIIETYALLDGGSTATFCDVELMKKFERGGTKLSL